MLESIKNLLKFENSKKYYLSVLLVVVSCALCEFGIGCFYTANIGTDPISVFVQGISFHCDLTVGNISTICNIILTILMLIFHREVFGTGTFIQVLIAGPLIDFFCGLVGSYFDANTASLLAKWILLLVGLVIYGLGLALCIDCNIGVSPFTFPPLFMSHVTPLSIKYCQIITDATFFLIGILLGGITGFGTIVAVLCTGPVMEFFIHLLKPLLDKALN